MVEQLNAIIDRQQRLLQLGVAAVATLIAFSESRADRMIAIVMYGVVPVAAGVLQSLWYRDVQLLQAIVSRVGNSEVETWRQVIQGHIERTRSMFPAIVVGSILASVLAGLLALRELRGIEGSSPYDARPTVLFAGYWILALVVLSWRSLWTWRQLRRPRQG